MGTVPATERSNTNGLLQKTCRVCGGVLFGSAGIRLLTSRDAKKAYSHAAAAALRAKDSVMETVTAVQENAADILATARDINAKKAADGQDEVVEDAAEA